jgi:geranylgeranyl pyrophosphate synthase
VIRLLEVLEPEPRAELVAVLSRPEGRHREALRIQLERSDAIAYARQKAVWFAEKATESLPSESSSPADRTLKELAEFVVTRDQ